jgi:hypothetical protein
VKLQQAYALVLLVLAATAGALAQSDVAIDSFTTGHYQSPAYLSGIYTSTQHGSMLGGSRTSTLALCNFFTVCGSENAYNLPSSFGVFAKNGDHPSGLQESAGFGTQSELDLEYGIGGDLNANFSGYDRIRVNFLALTGKLTADALLETNGGIDSYAENSCNLGYSDTAFSVEFPFDQFIASTGFDLDHVKFVAFTLNDTSKVGGVGYAIASIELSNHGAKGAIVCKSLSQQSGN